MSNTRRSAVILSLAVAGAISLACACGGTPTVPEAPDAEDTPGAAGDAAAAGSDATATTTADAPDSSTAPPAAPHQHAGINIGPSKMLDKVRKIGIDLTNPPELGKIKLSQKKKLMPLFQASLGMNACTGCHAEGDYKAETHNLKLTRGMWNHFVKDLRDNDGGALFCDSCHNGNARVLPRGDEDAMNKLMTDDYEGKLTRADGAEHSCSTCHTDVFENKVFENVWNIK